MGGRHWQQAYDDLKTGKLQGWHLWCKNKQLGVARSVGEPDTPQFQLNEGRSSGDDMPMQIIAEALLLRRNYHREM